ncbi:hypothetical protein VP01_2767g1, partial [Puccinia sorghi]
VVEVAKCKRRVSFLLVQASEVILGRPFLFAFRAGLRYDSARLSLGWQWSGGVGGGQR